MSWLEVSEDLPIDPDVGQVLIFDFEGTPFYLKIMRKSKGKVWAKEYPLKTIEETRQMPEDLKNK